MSQYIQIVKGVRKNDRKSQMAFYDLFFRPVFQSAFAITGNHDEAEEIMHDTLLKVFSKTDLLQEEPKAMTRFLKRMATNQAIDAVRKRKDVFIPSTVRVQYSRGILKLRTLLKQQINACNDE
jgi:RNA polymerase sigma-70 factor (ECF subfamily)